MKNFLKIFTLLLILSFFVGSFALAKPCCLEDGKPAGDDALHSDEAACMKLNPGKMTWICKETKTTSKTVSLTNPLGGDVTPQTFIGRIINAILGIIGSVSLVMFVFGGITMLTSMGNPEKMTKAKGILVGAILGLIIVFTSYALVRFVIQDMIGAK